MPSRHSAQHVALAAAVVLLAFAGMAYFSARGGQLPTLSTVEHHIEGLPELGYAALRSHLAQLNEPEAARAAVSTARRTLSVSSGVQFTAPQVKALRWLDAQPIEIDGLEGASFAYRFHDVPLSLIALPREAALDRFGLEQPPVKACLMREFERCFVDDVGTSLCLLTRDNALEIWVAHLPLPTLAKLAGAELD